MASQGELVDRIGRVIELSDDEVATELPALLDEMDGQVEELAMENPLLFDRIGDRMGEMNVGAFARDQPETVARFQGMLWTTMELLVRNSPEIRETLATDVAMNFDADDAPMTGSLTIDADESMLTGSTELHDDPDVVISGPADTLVSMVVGTIDPVAAFMRGEFEMDGDIQKGMQIGETMEKLEAAAPGESTSDGRQR